MINEAFEDKRLLEALNYIDERFIAEVTETYEVFDAVGEHRHNRRARHKAYRQFAAMAACLILLSGAFPVVVRFVSNTIDSIAGRGSGTTEENSLEFDSTEIDSPYERAIDAYPSDMSIDDIYEDIIKGGWVVLDCTYSKGFLFGNELWTAFIDKVNAKQPTMVLVADMARWCDISPELTGWHYTKPRFATLFLMEIIFDGETFSYKRLDCHTDKITDSGEYKYLITDIYEQLTEERTPGFVCYRETLCLTNDITWTYESFKNQAYTDEGRTTEFFSNPCQIIASYVPICEITDEHAAHTSMSLGFSELIVD